MQITNRRKAILLAALAAFGGAAPLAHAQDFPQRTINLVVAFAPGSPTDLVARQLANDLSTELKQTVIVDNRPGGSQTIAGSYVARAKPDGYTLYLANIPAIVAPSVQATLPFKGIRSFAPVASVVSVNLVMYAAPSVPAKTLPEFVALLRAHPDKYSYGSSGVATANHLVAELFQQQTGTHAVHVPYKGGGDVVQSLLSNQTAFGFVAVDTMQYVRAGKLKAFGIASLKRDASAPDLPTMDEGGVHGFQAAVDYVLVAPKGTPEDVTQQLNRAVGKVIASSSFTSKIAQIGGMEIAPPRDRAQTGAFIAQQEEKWDHTVKAANIKLD